jgi:hypothetical protein
MFVKVMIVFVFLLILVLLALYSTNLWLILANNNIVRVL